ncbi:MAG: racemase [Phycisphaerae bacterium]
MKRREFLAAVAGTAVLPRFSWADDLPRDVRITRVVAFDLPSRRPKFLGKNSRKDDHGDKATDRMIRIYTSAGVDGLGVYRHDKDMEKNRQMLSALLGKDPFAFYRREERRMVSPLDRGTMALWDLAGKVLKKPAWALLGGAGPARVPVYDGSIYMQDLLPQYADNWRDQFKKELDMGLKAGHTAFKIKIGRGAKWMEKEAGYARDIEVLKLIRAHVGPRITLGVDANDGWDLERTKKMLEELPDYDFAFIEQMFPKDVKKCLELKAFIREKGWKTLVAEGENDSRLDAWKHFIEQEAVDVLQGDIIVFGFEGVAEYAAAGHPHGIRVAPHNWGSNIGYHMQLQVGRALPNFYMAEEDPMTSDLLIAEGYDRKNGLSTVPDVPGVGLRLKEARFADAKVHLDLKG